jgi:hypothetical protein
MIFIFTLVYGMAEPMKLGSQNLLNNKIKRNNFKMDMNRGLDERYKVEECDENVIENIKTMLRQKDLLKILENSNVSEVTKLEYIEEYEMRLKQ